MFVIFKGIRVIGIASHTFSEFKAVDYSFLFPKILLASLFNKYEFWMFLPNSRFNLLYYIKLDWKMIIKDTFTMTNNLGGCHNIA